MKTVKTNKGTELPLVNLKGKDYLMVAYRLQWLTEDVPNYEISTELPVLTDEQTVARATVILKDKDGKVTRTAQATKRETKKDFSDHTEKAETAAIGRALAMLGYGTQHAISDLDEGQRLADSPLTPVKQETKPQATTSATTVNNAIVGNTTKVNITLPDGSAQASIKPPVTQTGNQMSRPSSFKQQANKPVTNGAGKETSSW